MSDATRSADADSFERPRAIARLWLAALLGPVAVLLHELVQYALVRWACTAHGTVVMWIVSLVLLLVILGAMLLGWFDWRRAGGGWSVSEGDVLARTRFMAISGIALGALSAIVLIAQAANLLMLSPCR